MTHLHSETQIALPLAWEAFRQACLRSSAEPTWFDGDSPTEWYPVRMDGGFLGWCPDAAGWRSSIPLWGGDTEAEVEARDRAEEVGLPTGTLEADHHRLQLVAYWTGEYAKVWLYLEPLRAWTSEHAERTGYGWIYIARHEQPEPQYSDPEAAMAELGGCVRMYHPVPPLEIDVLDSAGKPRHITVRRHVGGHADGDWGYSIDGSDPENGYVSRAAALADAVAQVAA